MRKDLLGALSSIDSTRRLVLMAANLCLVVKVETPFKEKDEANPQMESSKIDSG
jgi:hypothetical protein